MEHYNNLRSQQSLNSQHEILAAMRVFKLCVNIFFVTLLYCIKIYMIFYEKTLNSLDFT